MRKRIVMMGVLMVMGVGVAFSAPTIMEQIKGHKADVAKKYAELRMDYAKSEGYNPRPAYFAAYSEINDLFLRKKYAEVLEMVVPLLEKDPYNINCLHAKSMALQHLEKTEEAEAVGEILFGVIHSVLTSGDGRSSETAMRVITIDEEYAIVQFLGLRAVAQALVQKDGHFYDVLTVCGRTTPWQEESGEECSVKDEATKNEVVLATAIGRKDGGGMETEKTFTLYFNVDPLFVGGLFQP